MTDLETALRNMRIAMENLREVTEIALKELEKLKGGSDGKV